MTRFHRLHTDMEHGSSEFDVAKMARALGHALATRLALEVAVYGAHPRVHEAALLRSSARLVHNLGVFDLGDRVGFLVVGKPKVAQRML